MAMCNMHEDVLETFRRMKLETIFNIVPDEKTALLIISEQITPSPSADDELKAKCARWLGVPTEKVSIGMAAVWAQEQHKQ